MNRLHSDEMDALLVQSRLIIEKNLARAIAAHEKAITEKPNPTINYSENEEGEFIPESVNPANDLLIELDAAHQSLLRLEEIQYITRPEPRELDTTKKGS